MLLRIEHTCSIRNRTGAVIFQQDFMVSVAYGLSSWHIVEIQDEFDNIYDGPFYGGCKEALECDSVFCELVEAAIRGQRNGQRSNEEYESRHGSD